MKIGAKVASHGRYVTFQKVLKYLGRMPRGATFRLRSALYRGDKDVWLVVMDRLTHLSDVEELLYQVVENGKKVVLATLIPQETREYLQSLPGDLAEKTEVLELEGSGFQEALLRTRVAFITEDLQLVEYQLFGGLKDAACVMIYHGVITKAYGYLTQQKLNPQYNLVTNLSRIGIDIRCCTCEVELFFRATAEASNPREFRYIGHPRHDRCRALREGAPPRLSAETQGLMKKTEGKRRILYAPTHKDLEYATTLFPFEGFDKTKLDAVLDCLNAVLFLRLHPTEDNPDILSFIDEERIFSLSIERQKAVIETFPYLDAMISDYSSIYVDYLLFEKPILFVKDNHESFLKNRGIAFGYETYFPGPKLETFAEFEEQLTACLADDAVNAPEREFVRKVLLPLLPGSWFQRLLNQPELHGA